MEGDASWESMFCAVPRTVGTAARPLLGPHEPLWRWLAPEKRAVCAALCGVGGKGAWGIGSWGGTDICNGGSAGRKGVCGHNEVVH
jgi:hypothetical protein